MKLSEQLKVIAATDRIRIIQGQRGNREPQFDPGVKVLYCGFMGLMEYVEGKTEFLAQDPEVARMVAHMEVRHKQFKERGLFPPYEPEITRMYEFMDMTIFLYLRRDHSCLSGYKSYIYHQNYSYQAQLG